MRGESLLIRCPDVRVCKPLKQRVYKGNVLRKFLRLSCVKRHNGITPPGPDTKSESLFAMKKGQQAAAIILLAITAAILFGLWKTREGDATPESEKNTH